MTKLQRNVIDQLFLNGYLAKRDIIKSIVKGVKVERSRYTMYTGNKNPKRIYYEHTVRPALKLCKKDADGHYTLNLNLVRQQRKNSYVKQLYCAVREHKAVHGPL